MGHIFISYSHKDTDYAHKLADTLRSDGFDVWIDARIDYGSQWPHEIQKQLDSCDAFILIMTPRSFASEWVQSELQRAKRKLKPIFPLLREGDEPWLSVESTQYYDVRKGNVPDARFYSAIRHVVSRNEDGAAIQMPTQDAKKSPRNRSSVGSPKIRILALIAIIGAGATLLAVIIPLIWSGISQNIPSSSASDETPASSVYSPTEPGDAPATGISPNTSLDSANFTDPGGVEMRLVPEGEFTMGINADNGLAECRKYSSNCDRGNYEDEEPPHAVSLNAFYIDTYEVTNSLYAGCVDDGFCQLPTRTSSETRVSYFGNPEFDNFPVIFVDWNMANTFCYWRDARLPTEAEWEKAARGTDERTYPWGNEVDESQANYNNSIGDTAEAGNYDSGISLYGVYDMAGNVWEWVADYYSYTYYQDSPFENPLGPGSGVEHVLRGGSWFDTADLIRTTVRLMEPNLVDNNFGFRCARDAKP